MSAQVSILMPTYRQGHFISGAINSLLAQTFEDWELIIIDDASPDHTQEVVKKYLKDPRVRYHRNPQNVGLGAALNIGLTLAISEFIAYLPSDDIYFKDHLAQLITELSDNPDKILAYADMKLFYRDGPTSSSSLVSKGGNFPLQLVQVLHRKTQHKWIERSELVTDDLEKMFWGDLKVGGIVSTNQVSCEWVNHPWQRSKIIPEIGHGGIFAYKQYYNVKGPIKFQSTVGNYIDETIQWNISSSKVRQCKTPLKIVFVGELAYNPERIIVLKQQGHKLFGVWIDKPFLHNAVGPFPYDLIEDIPIERLSEKIDEIKPDVFYALLNFNIVPLAHSVRSQFRSIPFIWQLKESPFYCRQNGLWNSLMELYSSADGLIFHNDEARRWYQQFIDLDQKAILVMDNELPVSPGPETPKVPLLSDVEGDIHTVSFGRPYGLLPDHVKELAENRIHLHLYGEVNHSMWHDWVIKSHKSAGRYLHLHEHIHQEQWMSELQQYDAGWLHYFVSDNFNDITRLTWNDLNYPTRMATLAVAGLPMIQHDNRDHLVSSQELTKKLGIGIFFNSFLDLRNQLFDRAKMDELRRNVRNCRDRFTFDFHVDNLINFFRKIIRDKKMS